MADGHEITCSACHDRWTCHCLPGTTDPSTCLFDGKMCDDCAWDALDDDDDVAGSGA